MKRLWLPVAGALLPLSLASGCERRDDGASSGAAAAALREEGSAAPPSAPPALSCRDAEFIVETAQDTMLDVALGAEVAQKARSPEVKSLGERMVRDSARTNDELARLAARKGVPLPRALDEGHRLKLEAISALSGGTLEEAYTSDLVEDQEDDVKDFRLASIDAKDPDIRAWAAQKLPVVERHLSMAKRLQAKTRR